MIVIIDYGMGNLRSVLTKFQRVGYPAVVSNSIDEIDKADKLVLPGVGHFGKAMENLKRLNLIDTLNSRVIGQGIPILGICLGMQLFCLRSEEGNSEGLGWINAEIVRFDNDKINPPYKIPHMGWNTLKIHKGVDIFSNITEEDFFYFVHSYHVKSKMTDHVIASTNYGYEFVSAVQDKNIIGTQFHPEKSHKQGLQIIKKFAEI